MCVPPLNVAHTPGSVPMTVISFFLHIPPREKPDRTPAVRQTIQTYAQSAYIPIAPVPVFVQHPYRFYSHISKVSTDCNMCFRDIETVKFCVSGKNSGSKLSCVKHITKQCGRCDDSANGTSQILTVSDIGTLQYESPSRLFCRKYLCRIAQRPNNRQFLPG